MPLISVIVPCYNQAQYLDECLQSVLDQTYTDWECIIVNDGSPDHTEEIAKKWVEKDTRFIYLSKENGGLSSARNAGIEIAKGEWIQFLDSDDKISNDKFESASFFFENYDLIISNYQLFNQENLIEDYCSFKDEDLSFKSLLFNWDEKYTIPIHCAIFKKMNITNLFEESLKAKEDFIFWLHYLQKSPKYITLNNRQAYYRTHATSMTKDKNLMLQNEYHAFEYIVNYFKFEYLKDFTLLFIKRKKNEIIKLNELNKTLSKENSKLKNSRYLKCKQTIQKLIKSLK